RYQPRRTRTAPLGTRRPRPLRRPPARRLPPPGRHTPTTARTRSGGRSTMTSTDQGSMPTTQPEDPAMRAADPAMFAPLTAHENQILGTHLTSGWYKQAAVYPTLAEPWKETAALLDDLHGAWDIARQGRSHPAAASLSTELPEPEAGA